MLGTTKQRAIERHARHGATLQSPSMERRRVVRVALLVLALVAVAAVAFAVTLRAAPEAAPGIDITSGFEYNVDASSGSVASTPVTGQYFGNSPGLNADH